MAIVIIKACSCESSFQDERYGKSQRLMNETTKGFRCTVCGKDHQSNEKK